MGERFDGAQGPRLQLEVSLWACVELDARAVLK